MVNRRMRTNILIIVLLCFSLFTVSALAPVSVEAAAIMSPQFGVVGTYINVSGLTAGATYTIRWDGISLGLCCPRGWYSFFGAPETYRGPHSVVVESPLATVALATSFNIIPSIYMSPNSGPGGTLITISGTGFAPVRERASGI